MLDTTHPSAPFSNWFKHDTLHWVLSRVRHNYFDSVLGNKVSKCRLFQNYLVSFFSYNFPLSSNMYLNF